MVPVRVVTSIQRVVGDALAGRERVVLAVSGGLDSTVLLDAACRSRGGAGAHVSVATFDHRTGTAATDALRHVQRRCEELGVECDVGSADRELATEADFRDARWSFLRRIAAERSAVVMTAHTQDDQVETVLMRVMRDAGARGLAGLYASTDVVRPLVRTTRVELVAYAQERRLTWIEDPTNRSRRFLRNRVRHDLLPALRRACPSIDDDLLAIAQDAAMWRSEVESLVSAELDVRYASGGLDVSASALGHRTQAELSILWPEIGARVGATLDRRGTTRASAFVHTSRVGARIQLAGGWQVVRSRDAFQLRASREGAPQPRALNRELGAKWGDWTFRPSAEPVGQDAMAAWLPIDDELFVRSWRPGDTMVARVGGPARKVKYLLSKAGITGHERTHWPVVLSGNRIVWIPGVRHVDAATALSGRPGLAFTCEYHRR